MFDTFIIGHSQLQKSIKELLLLLNAFAQGNKKSKAIK